MLVDDGRVGQRGKRSAISLRSTSDILSGHALARIVARVCLPLLLFPSKCRVVHSPREMDQGVLGYVTISFVLLWAVINIYHRTQLPQLHTTEPKLHAGPNSLGYDEDGEEAFQYPGDSAGNVTNGSMGVAEDSDDDEFQYPLEDAEPEVEVPSPMAEEPAFVPPPAVETRNITPSPPGSVSSPLPAPTTQVSSTQLEALYAAGLEGRLSALKDLVENATENSDLEPFTFVNSASPITGLTVVHAAASRGRLDALKWRMFCSDYFSLTF